MTKFLFFYLKEFPRSQTWVSLMMVS